MAQDNKENQTDNKKEFAGIPGLTEVINKVAEGLTDKAKDDKQTSEPDKKSPNKDAKAENLESELAKETKGNSR